MPRWIVLEGEGHGEPFTYSVHRELEGTEAEALASLRHIIDTYDEPLTAGGRRRQRRQVYRVSDRRYFVRIENLMLQREAHFALAELIADTHDDSLPDTASA